MTLLSHFRWDRFVPVLVVATLLVGSFQNENFLTTGNMTFLIQSVGEIMLIAFAMTFLIIAGEIDLSVSSTAALSSCSLGFTWQHTGSLGLAVVAAIATGVVCGAVNGFLVTQLGLQSLAVTIGTLALYRGLCYALLGDGRLKPFPTSFTSLNYRGIAGTWVPYVTVPLVVFGIAFGVVLHATPFGRWVFAIGQSKEAARFAGIPVRKVVFRLFVVNGLMAGIAGVVYTIRFASARPDGAVGFELEVIAAALFAGVSIFGGVGTMWAVASSVLFLGSIRSLLRLNDFTANQLTIVTGSLLLASVVIPAVAIRVRHRTGSDPPPIPRQPSAPGRPGPDVPVTEQG
jgi:rhamnose transport system permease protein